MKIGQKLIRLNPIHFASIRARIDPNEISNPNHSDLELEIRFGSIRAWIHSDWKLFFDSLVKNPSELFRFISL